MIDAYGHVGLPRFVSLADYRQIMARTGITQAVLCSFDSSPDLNEIHAAVRDDPATFRAVGVPLGTGRAEVEAGVAAQLAAGFSGLRLTDVDVAERPWLVDMVGRAGAVALVVGAVSSAACAAALLGHLARHPGLRVVGGHFAGLGDPALLAGGPAAELFGHDRFHVQFSRQGGWPAPVIRGWAEAVLARTGWRGVIWGTEVPLLFWRNESVGDAAAWLRQFGPDEAQFAAATGGNARRTYFDPPCAPGPLQLPFDPMDRAKPIPAVMWSNGCPVDQDLAGQLVHAWLQAGGQGTLGTYAAGLLRQALAGTAKPR